MKDGGGDTGSEYMQRNLVRVVCAPSIQHQHVFNELLQGPTVLLKFMIMLLTNYYEAPRQDSNLGPKPLFLLENEI